MASNITVLIVDDFSTTRRIISSLLRQLGIEYIYEAAHGQEAMEILGDGGIDLVITDWHMPVMDGLQLVTSMRTHPLTVQVPVLMVTAESRKEQMRLAAVAGVNGYIVKPFTADILRTKLVRIAERLGDAHLLAMG